MMVGKLVKYPALMALAKVSNGGQKRAACWKRTLSAVVGDSTIAFREWIGCGSIAHSDVGCRVP